jgi:hypothetical protein
MRGVAYLIVQCAVDSHAVMLAVSVLAVSVLTDLQYCLICQLLYDLSNRPLFVIQYTNKFKRMLSVVYDTSNCACSRQCRLLCTSVDTPRTGNAVMRTALWYSAYCYAHVVTQRTV